jgi:hypothetical protein
MKTTKFYLIENTIIKNNSSILIESTYDYPSIIEKLIAWFITMKEQAIKDEKWKVGKIIDQVQRHEFEFDTRLEVYLELLLELKELV